MTRTGLGGVLALLLAAPPLGAQSDAHDSGAWYARLYGLAGAPGSPDAALVAEAEVVFARLSAVADHKAGRRPHLLVVNMPDGFEHRSLGDGAILINPNLIRFCFGPPKRPKDHGHARLAFVLGHEMAHLAGYDNWHTEAFAALNRHGDPPLADSTKDLVRDSVAEARAKELRADRAGFLFMLMAGYPPEAVVGPRSDFLNEYSRHVASDPTLENGRHPRFPERSKVLTAQLKAIQESLPFHRFGARLLALDRHEDAIRMLERFYVELPSREVGANLGLAYYRRGLARLAACGDREAFRYRLFTLIDPDTVAGRLHLRGEDPAACGVRGREDLESAEKLLKEAHANDSGHAPARLNLAAVMIARGRGLDAYRVAADDSPGVAPDARLAIAGAVAFHVARHATPLDTTDAALQVLRDLETREARESSELHAAIAFNRARILQERDRPAAARAAWEAFLSIEQQGAYADEARLALLKAQVTSFPPASKPPARTIGPPLMDRLSPALKRRVRDATRQPFVLGELRGAFLEAGDMTALELGGVLEIVEEPVQPALALAAVEQEMGPPRATVELSAGRRTVLYGDVAYDVAQGRIMRRVYFEPR